MILAMNMVYTQSHELNAFHLIDTEQLSIERQQNIEQQVMDQGAVTYCCSYDDAGEFHEAYLDFSFPCQIDGLLTVTVSS